MPTNVIELPHARIDLARRVVEGPDGVTARLSHVEASFLGVLLAERGRAVSRDRLLTEVWGYAPVVRSRACDIAVARIRRKIESDPAQPLHLLTVHGEGYVLAPLPGVEDHAAELPPLRARVALGGGRWVDLSRAECGGPAGHTSLTSREVAVLATLIDARGAIVDAAALRRRVWGTSHSRAVPSAVSRLRKKLEADGTRPTLLLTAGSGYRLALPDVGERRSGLPADVDARFGRDAELRAIDEAFERGDRLVSLVGPGGVGKSRVALAFATGWSARGPAFWVDLSQAVDVDTFAARLALRLAFQLGVGGVDPLDALGDAVRTLGDVLLVFDEVERLIPGGTAAIGHLLAACPRVRVLATSRVALGLRGERRCPVGPLDPASAIALFVDRSPRPPDPSDPVLRALVDDLDHLPLALELAARRTAVLSLPALRDALRDPEHALAVADPSRPPRHRSLRACLDASVALLSPPARDAFARLGVFARRVELDVARRVLPSGSTVDLLQELADANLLAVDAEGYGIAAHVRDYARGLLDDAGRADAEARHRRAFAALGTPEALRRLDGPDEAEARRRLESCLDELLRALDSAFQAEDADTAVAVASAAWEVLARTGPYRSALPWVGRLLALPAGAALRSRARLLAARVRHAAAGPGDLAAELADAARDAASLGRPDLEAEIALERAAVAHALESPDGEDLARVALAAARRSGDAVLSGRAACAVGRALVGERWREAVEVLRPALDAALAAGSPRSEAELRRWLARARDAAGDPGAAHELRRAAELAVSLGDRRLEAEVLVDLAMLGTARFHPWGDASIERAITLFEALGDRAALAGALVSKALLDLNARELDRAAAGLSRAERLAAAAGAAPVLVDITLRRAVVARGQRRHDEADQMLDEVVAGPSERLRRLANVQRGWVRLERGDAAGALQIWLGEHAHAVEVGRSYVVAQLEILLGAAHRPTDVAAALHHWDRAAVVAESNGYAAIAVQALGNAAMALAETGDTQAARRHLGRMEELQLDASPGLALMRAIAAGVAAHATEPGGEEARRWLADADHLAELHSSGLAWAPEREELRRRIG